MHPRSSGANKSEASPYYSIDITKMRNSLLQSVSSQLDSHENELEICGGSMQMNNLIGFNMESRLFNNDNQLGKRVYTESSHAQSLIYDKNHKPGSLYVISGCNDISQQSLLLDKDPSLSQYEGVSGNARKRPFEYSCNMSLRETMKNNSKPKWHQTKETSEIIPRHQLCVPMRRKHKLSEKVTVLQKLVSPFGKTDTASVLHEASLYIKLIQSQIRTLFQMLSLSYISTTEAPHQQEYGDKLQVDLRSRGLCLVPMSITETVTMEDQVHPASASRTILPRNF